MFATHYYFIDDISGIMNELTNLKKIENTDEQAHRELEAIAAVLRICGVKWRFKYDENKDIFVAVLVEENVRKFRDTESGDIVTIDELRAEFESLKASDPETFDYDFSGYIRNCTSKNGFLEELK